MSSGRGAITYRSLKRLVQLLTSQASFVAACTVLVSMMSLQSCSPRSSNYTGLPHKRVPVVLYDNDEVVDVYTDDYVMALAAAGDIRLAGLITSTSTAPFNRWVGEEDHQRMVRDRLNSIELARGIGWPHIPDHVSGSQVNLSRPRSGHVDDTRPIVSAGSLLVVEEARKATPEQPLVLVMGGPLTLAADAYLIDRSIADRLLVMWLGGGINDMGGYNGWADPWAAYIVLTQLRLMQFPEGLARPFISKSRLRAELPASSLTEWMVLKKLSTSMVQLPGEHDEDGPPAIALVRHDYVQEVKRVSFSHWEALGKDSEPREVPVLKDDPQGRAIVVTEADEDVATEEWWRALRRSLPKH